MCCRKKKKYVVLEGIEKGNQFWSRRGEGDPTRLADGTVAYRILLETDDPADCQRALYGYAPDYGESLPAQRVRKTQRQDSVTDQLLDLADIARVEGMYDAEDFLRRAAKVSTERGR